MQTGYGKEFEPNTNRPQLTAATQKLENRSKKATTYLSVDDSTVEVTYMLYHFVFQLR
jgi:hypothetical protein